MQAKKHVKVENKCEQKGGEQTQTTWYMYFMLSHIAQQKRQAQSNQHANKM